MAANNQLVRTREAEWKPLDEPGITGIAIKVLRFDPGTGRAPAFLLKLDPGARYPAHNHPEGEETYVLEGEVHFGPDRLGPGDYLYTAPGNAHAVWTTSGCTLLFNVPAEVEILKPWSNAGS